MQIKHALAYNQWALFALLYQRSRTNNASDRCQACDSSYRPFQN
jgi:hypothetical protein